MPRYLAVFSAAVVMLPWTNSAAAEPVRREWSVDGVKREALVHVPATAQAEPAPVVFAFHGHGGSMQNAAKMFKYHTLWPQAIVVYMQGLNTPGKLTDPDGKKPGWQHEPGDQADRDLKFFDAVLASLKSEFKVDENRIHSTGHSNGGGFTYLLWDQRSDIFASMAPSGSAAGRRASSLKPKPAMHIAGDNDPLVKFAWQQESIKAIQKINECAEVDKPWEAACKIYESPSGNHVVTLITSSGHTFPRDAPPLIVKFFKSHPKPETVPAEEPVKGKKAAKKKSPS